MAFATRRLVLLLLVQCLAASVNSQGDELSEYRTPDCNQYKLSGCPRDFNPVCGDDMSTYSNECTLCMKIRESVQAIKIIRSGPC